MRSMMADMGVTTHVRVWSDSNAVKTIVSRKRSRKDSTRGVEVFVTEGCDQVRAESGRPLNEGKGMVSD